MIDELLRGFGLRTGRFTSPHLSRITERIVLDGEPISDRAFVEAYREIAPYLELVDGQFDIPLSFFEVMVGAGLRDLRRRPGRRRRRRGRPRRRVGRHQRHRRRGRGGDARSTSTTPSTSAPRSTRSPARRPASSSPAPPAILAAQPPEARRAAAAPRRRGRGHRRPRGARVRRPRAPGRRRRPGADPAGPRRRLRRGVPAAARRAPGRRTPPARWPPSRRSSAPAPRPDRSTSTSSAPRSPPSARRAGSRRCGRRRRSCVDAAHNPPGMRGHRRRHRRGLRLPPADRRGRRCWPTRTCAGMLERARAGRRRGRGHPERLGPGRARRRAGRRRPSRCSAPDRVTVEPRLDDAIETAVRLAEETGDGVLARAPACWSPARSSRPARHACCSVRGRVTEPDAEPRDQRPEPTAERARRAGGPGGPTGPRAGRWPACSGSRRVVVLLVPRAIAFTDGGLGVTRTVP